MYKNYIRLQLEPYYQLANRLLEGTYIDGSIIIKVDTLIQYRYEEGIKLILPFYLEKVPIRINYVK